jgi:hypothetical protein
MFDGSRLLSFPSRVGEKIELAGFDRYSFLTSLVLSSLNLNSETAWPEKSWWLIPARKTRVQTRVFTL